jgi:hypothetical protein
MISRGCVPCPLLFEKAFSAFGSVIDVRISTFFLTIFYGFLLVVLKNGVFFFFGSRL